MIRRKIFMRGAAIFCVVFLSVGNIQVYAEEYEEQSVYEQVEEVVEEDEEIIEENEEKIEAGIEENETDETDYQDNPKEDDLTDNNIKQLNVGTDIIVSGEKTDQDNIDNSIDDINELESVVEPDEDTVLENEDKEEMQEEIDGDPQKGVSMSNIEEVSESGNGSIFKSRSSVRSTYVHNSRYNSGYDVINGIDVSYHNGTVNWSAVKASGMEYAIIRVGYRGYGSSGSLNEDVKFKENVKGALSAGLKVGVYFFSQATSEEEAVEEANYILKKISGYNITLPVVIDFEYANDSSGKLVGRLYNANLSRSSATSICKKFCRTIEASGYTSMVYANRSMLESGVYASDLSSQYKIWLASYTTKTDYAGDYYAWQYTSKGSVNGISGYVDCNFFYEKKRINVNLTDAREYVRKLYRILLEREADENGLNNHSIGIAEGRYTASDMALIIIESVEFAGKKYSDQTYVEKLYQVLLNRNGNSVEISNWVNRMKSGVSRRYILAQFTGSSEFANVCAGLRIPQGNIQLIENRDKNPAVTAYVSRCYLNILGRAADSPGLNTWTGKILSGNGGAEIVKDLVVSIEFLNKKKTDDEFIDILYKAMLGRNADKNGKEYWLNCLEEGVSRVYVINGFSKSTEFKRLCTNYGIMTGTARITEARDRNIGVTGFVNRNYKIILRRKGEAAGLNFWCNAILNKSQTPAQVAYGFVFSAENTNKNLDNSDFVELMYETMLGRKSDLSGKKYWVNALNSGQTREHVFWRFANSAEFRAIVAGYGL